LAEQVPELVEERAGKIVLAPIAFGIPLVGPPYTLAVDRVRRVGPMRGKNLFSRKVAGTLIKDAVRLPPETAHQPALRAPRRRWHLHLLVKSAVVGIDMKNGRTGLAGTGL